MLLVSGCGTRPMPAVLTVPSAKPVIPSNLLQPCPPLPAATDPSLAGLLGNHVAVAESYQHCAALHRELADAVRGQPGIITSSTPAAAKAGP
jgi:hypothetical protein